MRSLWRLETLFQVATYALAAMGLFAIQITVEISPFAMGLAYLAWVAGWINDNRTKPFRMAPSFWNVVTIVFFLYEVLQVLQTDRELVVPVTEFLIALQGVRLLSEKSDREILQIYGLSMLHLIAASVLTSSLGFSGIFLLYIIVGTCALVLYNLRRETTSLPSNAVQAVLTPRFFGVIVAVAIGVFLGSLLLFFSFPRLNYNYFAPLLRNPLPQSGFSDQVRLGVSGNIRMSDQPVMRVTISGPLASQVKPGDLYLAGAILSHYDGRTWTHEEDERGNSLMTSLGRPMALGRNRIEDADIIQEIITEPSGRDVMFGIREVIGLKTPFGIVGHKDGLNFQGSFSGGKRIRYEVYSRLQNMERSGRLETVRSRRGDESEENLELPIDLDSRIEALAFEVAGTEADAYQAARRIQDYLKRNFSYSLEMPKTGPEDPLSFFLFEGKSGHCEYFASALAVMLRSLGVPARLVNGYYHGQWNELGGYYLIRQRHAHSWVEVFDESRGWRRFDPTPPDPLLGIPATFSERFQQAFDSMQLFWVRWVVDYSIQEQTSAARSVFSFAKKANLPDLRTNERFDLADWAKRHLRGFESVLLIGLGTLFLFGVSLLAREVVRRRSRRGLTLPEVDLYERMERLLRKHGIERHPSQTPEEFLHGVEQRTNAKIAHLVSQVTRLYERLRYRGLSMTTLERASGQNALRHLREALILLRRRRA